MGWLMLRGVSAGRLREHSTNHAFLSHARSFAFRVCVGTGGRTTALQSFLSGLGATRYFSGVRMAEQHEWNAVRVRDTFLQYFKDKGHTFGECNFISIFLEDRRELRYKQSNFHCWGVCASSFAACCNLAYDLLPPKKSRVSSGIRLGKHIFYISMRPPSRGHCS